MGASSKTGGRLRVDARRRCGCRRALLATLFALLAAPAFAAERATENVVLVTIDGLRWQEVFSGADAVLTGPGERKAVAWVDDVTGTRRGAVSLLDHLLAAHDLRRGQTVRSQGVAVLTARGCPYDCPYCAAALLADPDWVGGFRPREPARRPRQARAPPWR